MTPAKESFLQQLAQIQSFEVGSLLCQIDRYETTEAALTDLSYHLINRILELLDGYGPKKGSMSIVGVETK